MKPIKTLGISYMAYDTSAALMVDGELISSCEQERYNLDKHSREFPFEAIKGCLNSANLTINDIDTICFGFNPDLYHNYPSKENLNRRPLPLKKELDKKVKKELC